MTLAGRAGRWDLLGLVLHLFPGERLLLFTLGLLLTLSRGLQLPQPLLLLLVVLDPDQGISSNNIK